MTIPLLKKCGTHFWNEVGVLSRVIYWNLRMATVCHCLWSGASMVLPTICRLVPYHQWRDVLLQRPGDNRAEESKAPKAMVIIDPLPLMWDRSRYRSVLSRLLMLLPTNPTITAAPNSPANRYLRALFPWPSSNIPRTTPDITARQIPVASCAVARRALGPGESTFRGVTPSDDSIKRVSHPPGDVGQVEGQRCG